MSTPATIPFDRLARTALFVQQILKDNHFSFSLLGGFQLQAMGSPRGTQDVDFVVKRPFFRGVDKIYHAFSEHPDTFKVIPVTIKDEIRIICVTEGVGVDILIQELPESLDQICIAVDEKEEVMPCFPMQSMVFKKINCLAVRIEGSDLTDLEWLHDNCQHEITWSKIAAKVKQSGDIEKAVKNFPTETHPFMAKLLEVLGIDDQVSAQK
ncbi:hypothetical protein HGRIS_003806 [Hohenbuehelia grisea]|uniref:Uncharacterized protein n=1 Tax=Hohenbuehelia grisea TaxID=104357 RepID=A0ABR3JGM3_9AGAR